MYYPIYFYHTYNSRPNSNKKKEVTTATANAVAVAVLYAAFSIERRSLFADRVFGNLSFFTDFIAW